MYNIKTKYHNKYQWKEKRAKIHRERERERERKKDEKNKYIYLMNADEFIYLFTIE